MEILFKNSLTRKPSVSIVLLDWSVRESFHSLDYLNHQTIQRENYEVIWIEYYDRRSKEIESKLRECAASGRPPIVDSWIVMDMPKTVYYHKHLMYNMGIIVSSGRIICFCDSDAAFSKTFIESIIQSFDTDSNIVLHMDEIRSVDKKFYPFNYPSLDEIMHSPCLNLMNGKPRGLVDMSNPLHWRNGGACMCAIREDLIKIGGADEHIDYLGHICGPYEMTFRLVNAGKKEVWHPEEWIYHTWHPGQAGDKNFAGPHDGRGVSQTALTARRTGRIAPLVENPAIQALRLNRADISLSLLHHRAISDERMQQWVVDDQQYNQVKYPLGSATIDMKEFKKENSVSAHTALKSSPFDSISLYILRMKVFFKCFYVKIPFIMETIKKFLRLTVKKNSIRAQHSEPAANLVMQVNGIRDIIRLGINFLKYLMGWSRYVMDRCRQCIHDLTAIGIREIAVFGAGDEAKALCILSRTTPVKVTAVYDSPVKTKKIMGHDVLPLEKIKGYQGKVVIASFDDMVRKLEMLKEIGIPENMIVDLW